MSDSNRWVDVYSLGMQFENTESPQECYKLAQQIRGAQAKHERSVEADELTVVLRNMVIESSYFIPVEFGAFAYQGLDQNFNLFFYDEDSLLVAHVFALPTSEAVVAEFKRMIVKGSLVSGYRSYVTDAQLESVELADAAVAYDLIVSRYREIRNARRSELSAHGLVEREQLRDAMAEIVGIRP